MDAVEEIKQRLSVEDVVGEYVELKRSGRNYKGLSPFTSERTPSFMVSPEKQIWHDFSSGRGGDIFKFVMEMEGLDFRGALEHLARKAGVDLSMYEKGNGGVRKKKDAAHNALAMAVRYYQQSLLKNEQALQYVTQQRKLRRQTIADFGIGYAPNNGRALTDALSKKSITYDDMKLAGLITERYGRTSDMFRGRIMIPLFDPQGNPLGFTARLLDATDNGPKYINTPQTILYDKSRHVFGLHVAKDAIRTSGFVVIVEGNMDVISTHQAGYKNVVAAAGTALTVHQLKALQRLTSDIRLCFDQDAAGITAAERAIDVAQSVGVQLSIISLPEGKDPDELIQKNQELWEQAMHTPVYAVDWLIERYKELYDTSTATGKKKFSDALARIVNRLQDSVEKDHYIKTLASVADVSESAITTKLRVMKSGDKTALKKPRAAIDTTLYDQDAYQDRLLSLLVMFPITRRFLETADTTYFVFSSPERQRVFEYVSQNPHSTITSSIPEDLKDVEDYVKILLLKAEELYAVGFDANERLRELQDLIEKLKTKYFANQRQQLSEQIKQAEDAGDEKRVAELLDEFNQLLKKGQ
jgi:DNA primase